MNVNLDEHKHILTYLDGAKQQEPDTSPGKGFNSEVTVKVRWNMGTAEKHQLRRLQPLRWLFDEYADREDVSAENIVFELLERRVSPDDTPDALGLSVASVLCGYKVARKLDTSVRTDVDKPDGQTLEIKVQMVDRRTDKVTVQLKTQEPMAKVYAAVAEAMKVAENVVRLNFDGYLVEREQTAQELELEGGEVFDCVLATAND